MPSNSVCCTRPGRWGNYSGDGSHAAYAKAAYQHDLEKGRAGRDRNLGIEDAKRELRGKNIGCFCKVGDPCHGDVLIELANRK